MELKRIWFKLLNNSLSQGCLTIDLKSNVSSFSFPSADSTIDPYGKTHFLVESDGSILWVPPAKLKAFCKLRMRCVYSHSIPYVCTFVSVISCYRYWPLDTQKCKLKFGSWTSHGGEIDLKLYRNTSTVKKGFFFIDINFCHNRGKAQV